MTWKRYYQGILLLLRLRLQDISLNCNAWARFTQTVRVWPLGACAFAPQTGKAAQIVSAPRNIFCCELAFKGTNSAFYYKDIITSFISYLYSNNIVNRGFLTISSIGKRINPVVHVVCIFGIKDHIFKRIHSTLDFLTSCGPKRHEIKRLNDRQCYSFDSRPCCLTTKIYQSVLVVNSCGKFSFFVISIGSVFFVVVIPTNEAFVKFLRTEGALLVNAVFSVGPLRLSFIGCCGVFHAEVLRYVWLSYLSF